MGGGLRPNDVLSLAEQLRRMLRAEGMKLNEVVKNTDE